MRDPCAFIAITTGSKTYQRGEWERSRIVAQHLITALVDLYVHQPEFDERVFGEEGDSTDHLSPGGVLYLKTVVSLQR